MSYVWLICTAINKNYYYCHKNCEIVNVALDAI